MKLATVKNWIEKNALAEHCSIDTAGNNNYFSTINFCCDCLRVYTLEYSEIKRYLNRYKKTLSYTLDFRYGLGLWEFLIYNAEDQANLAEYSYYQKQSVRACEAFIHENKGLAAAEVNQKLSDIMREHEKRYERSRRFGIYKTLNS